MKVKDLISLLEDQDPEAEVFLAEQPSWPFEYSISNVISREEMLSNDDEYDELVSQRCCECGAEVDDECELHPDADVDVKHAEPKLDEGCTLSDVFIIEGEQLRYGSKAAWSR
jgi:hypothetical protein